MELFQQSFQAVAILLGIGVFGFWIVSRQIVPAQALKFLSPLALEIALPCLIFARITRQFELRSYPHWWLLPLAWLAFTVGAALFTALVMLLSRPSTRSEFGMTLFYQNAIFVPLVILTEMFGSDSQVVVKLFFFVMFFSALLFATYPWFFGTGSCQRSIGKIFHPVLLVTGLAIGGRLAGIQVYIPEFILSAMEMVGQMTVPLLMLILGGSIYVDMQEHGKVHYLEVAKFVFLKNLLLPFVTLGVLVLIKPGYDIALIVLLQSAVPPVTAAPVLTKRAGGDSALVSQFLVASFLVSLISLPAMLAVFGVAFPA